MRTMHWAWRNVRARGWRSALTIGLLALAVAANATVFSAVDSLVFRRVAYPEADRLMAFATREAQTGRAGSGFATAPLLDEWRKQTDLFSAVHGHVYKTIFLTGGGEPELVSAADVTPGLIEMLGVRPRWGRSLSADDARRTDVHVVVVAESLARDRFGDPSRAVGQVVDTTAEPLQIVGVMPASFRFPQNSQRIWRVFDPRGPLARNVGIALVARRAPTVSEVQVSEVMGARSEAIHRAAGARADVIASPAPLLATRFANEPRRLLLLLLGAAVTLLLTASANTAALELAGAIGRARTHAIQLAVGASRGELVRTALVEGVALAAAATVLGVWLAQDKGFDSSTSMESFGVGLSPVDGGGAPSKAPMTPGRARTRSRIVSTSTARSAPTSGDDDRPPQRQRSRLRANHDNRAYRFARAGCRSV